MAVPSVRAHHLPSFEGSSCGRLRVLKSKDFSNLSKIEKNESNSGYPLPLRSPAIAHDCRAHCNQGFFSGKLVRDTSLPRFLESWKEEDSKLENISSRACACRTESDRFKQIGYDNWGVCREASVSESRSKSQVKDLLAFEVSERRPNSWGWLSLGFCGNALITRIGNNSRPDVHKNGSAFDPFYAPTKTGDITMSLTQRNNEATSRVTMTSTTKSHLSKQKGKNNQKKSSVVARDLFERSSFHLCEVMFSYPFVSPNSIGLSVQYLSREKLRQVVGVINQIAIGLAGMGMASLFFVASRMLSINASFDKHQVLSLAVGASFFSVSFATLKVADVLKCMADAHSKARPPKREHLVKLQRELQSMVVNTVPLLVMCIINLA